MRVVGRGQGAGQQQAKQSHGGDREAGRHTTHRYSRRHPHSSPTPTLTQHNQAPNPPPHLQHAGEAGALVVAGGAKVHGARDVGSAAVKLRAAVQQQQGGCVHGAAGAGLRAVVDDCAVGARACSGWMGGQAGRRPVRGWGWGVCVADAQAGTWATGARWQAVAVRQPSAVLPHRHRQPHTCDGGDGRLRTAHPLAHHTTQPSQPRVSRCPAYLRWWGRMAPQSRPAWRAAP